MASESPTNNVPVLLECTIRDGSYATAFTLDEVRGITRALAQAGFEWIEAGNGLGLGCYRQDGETFPVDDATGLSAARESIGRAQLGAFFIPRIGTTDDLKLGRDCGVDFVRIGCNTRSYTEGLRFIEAALQLGYKVFFNFMKSYVVSKFALVKYAKEVESTGVLGIYLVDSAGGMLPREVGDYIALMRENLRCELGFHGHNNLQLVNANNIAAIENGARFVDTTLKGVGRGGGNSPTETMQFVLERMGYRAPIDRDKVFEACGEFFADKKDKLGTTDIDVVSGFAMFHSSYLKLFNAVATDWGVDVRDLIVRVCEIEKENPDKALVEGVAKQLYVEANRVFKPREHRGNA